MRIPFDSLVLRAIVAELQPLVGARVENVLQPDEWTIHVVVHQERKNIGVLLCCHPEFARVHLATQRAPKMADVPPFCAALRSKLLGATLVGVEQVGFDRILDLRLTVPGGAFRIVGEFMGKHSNLILVNESGNVVAAAKNVPPTASVRPIQPGKPYSLPPFAPKPSMFEAKDGDDPRNFEGASPFLLKLIGLGGLEVIRQPFRPVHSPGSGAYPISVAPLDLPEVVVSSMSVGLEAHFSEAHREAALERLRLSLINRLERVKFARELAVKDLHRAADDAAMAASFQLRGELILAYGFGLPEGSASLTATDYEGNEIVIELRGDLSPLENAQRYFAKAKKAKTAAPQVREQLERLTKDLSDLEVCLHAAINSDQVADLETLAAEAQRRKWLHAQPSPNMRAEDKPYEGKRVRSLLGPHGYAVLYGENAEANDYLTLRVARPDDLWLHVRGSTSAHVVIQTHKQPNRVPPETLRFAAQVAVQNSSSKHSGYVPVDYTLKKYVRKPRGGKAGTALYTHEKTLHIDT